MTAAALAIVNPAAGGGVTDRRWPGLRDALRTAGVDFEWAATRAPGDGTRLAREAVAAGRTFLIAVGGDGTLNEVVNGATGEGAIPRATVGVLPTGRGRDACRNLGLPSRLATAVAALATGHDTTFDLGLARWADGTRRYFVNAAGVGFDASVARAATSGRGGTIPYLLAVLRTLRHHRPRPASLEVDGDRGRPYSLTAAVIANGAYYGGGMKIAPAADPADGTLDLVVIGSIGRLALLGWLPALYRGRHLAHPRVDSGPARRVTIAAPVPLPTHVDGEAAGDTPVTLTVCARGLRLRVPAGASRGLSGPAPPTGRGPV